MQTLKELIEGLPPELVQEARNYIGYLYLFNKAGCGVFWVLATDWRRNKAFCGSVN